MSNDNTASGWGQPGNWGPTPAQHQPSAPQGQPSAPQHQPSAPQHQPSAPQYQPSAPRPPAPQPPGPGYASVPPPGAVAAPSGAGRVVRPVVSSILVWVSGLLASLGMVLPWNYAREFVHSSGGGFTFQRGRAWNGFDQAFVNIDQGRFYGWLALLAFALLALGMLIANVCALIAIITNPKGSALRIVVLVGVIICLLATLGVFVGYLALGALREAAFGVYIYAFSYVLGLVGAVGMVGKKF